MQETWVRSLGGEDPLEEGMATHSSTLAWGILWTEEPGGLQSGGLQRVRQDRAANTTERLTFLWARSWEQAGGGVKKGPGPVSQVRRVGAWTEAAAEPRVDLGPS